MGTKTQESLGGKKAKRLYPWSELKQWTEENKLETEVERGLKAIGIYDADWSKIAMKKRCTPGDHMMIVTVLKMHLPESHEFHKRWAKLP